MLLLLLFLFFAGLYWFIVCALNSELYIYSFFVVDCQNPSVGGELSI